MLYRPLALAMSCTEGSLPLPWSIRMKIALGAAKGLSFLHEEAERPVIYRDFKTSNILLDAVCSVYLLLSSFPTSPTPCPELFSCNLASRITMPSSLILGSLKMALKETKLTSLLELWAHMVMQLQST